MLPLLGTLLLQPVMAAPLEIEVDPDATKVVLDCTDRRVEQDVRDGKVSFDFNGQDCKVSLFYGSGTVDGTGRFRCDRDGCTLIEIPHRPFSDGPGVINFLFVGDTSSTRIELTCEGGYRARSKIDDHVATFTGVPDAKCAMNLKGALNAKFPSARIGSYRCTVSPPVANCVPAAP